MELVEGCSDCELEAEYLASIDHECGQLCRMGRRWRESEEYHRISHEPERCEDCNAVLNDRLGHQHYVVGLCKSKCCTQWRCPYCKGVHSSAGPVECPTCGDPWARRYFRRKRKLAGPTKLSRIHAGYRLRRRFW